MQDALCFKAFSQECGVRLRAPVSVVFSAHNRSTGNGMLAIYRLVVNDKKKQGKCYPVVASFDLLGSCLNGIGSVRPKRLASSWVISSKTARSTVKQLAMDGWRDKDGGQISPSNENAPLELGCEMLFVST